MDAKPTTPHRQPKPGETCVCGQRAKVVLIKKFGEVPTCQSLADIAKVLEHVGQELTLQRHRGIAAT
jgi:inhibitor of KinA sporulation pathway (predicted exonuclease)